MPDTEKSSVSEKHPVTDTEKGFDTDKHYRKVEKYLFFMGFIFPIAWFIGSAYRCGDRQATFVWRKRCTVASTLLLTVVSISIAIVMVVKPDTFGLRTSNGGNQKTSAIRPGVPIANSSDWSDAAAGISINE
ncbi:unnamed protein product [Rhizopus stolonifer]